MAAIIVREVGGARVRCWRSWCMDNGIWVLVCGFVFFCFSSKPFRMQVWLLGSVCRSKFKQTWFNFDKLVLMIAYIIPEKLLLYILMSPTDEHSIQRMDDFYQGVEGCFIFDVKSCAPAKPCPYMYFPFPVQHHTNFRWVRQIGWLLVVSYEVPKHRRSIGG